MSILTVIVLYLTIGIIWVVIELKQYLNKPDVDKRMSQLVLIALVFGFFWPMDLILMAYNKTEKTKQKNETIYRIWSHFF